MKTPFKMNSNSGKQFSIIPKNLNSAYPLASGCRGTNEGPRRRPACAMSLSRALGLLTAVALVLEASSCQHPQQQSGVVWAEVNGQPIFRRQVEEIYQRRTNMSGGEQPNSGIGGGGSAADKEEALSFKLNILDELIDNQILLAHAAHAGITVSEAEVDTKMSQLESPYTKQEFEQKLAQQGMTESDLREEVRDSLMVSKLITKDIDSRISVSDADIKAYYERNKAAFNVPETEYHLAQIEVTPRPDNDVRNLKNDDAKTPAAAKRKIEALYAQLRAGADFSMVAQEYSEDPATTSSGGDMGFISASGLDANPALKRIVKSLHVGQISGIIETKTAYHIIKLLGIEQAGQGQVSNPNVQSSIRKTLINEKEQVLRAAYIETLRNQAKVKNLLARQIVQQGAESVK